MNTPEGKVKSDVKKLLVERGGSICRYRPAMESAAFPTSSAAGVGGSSVSNARLRGGRAQQRQRNGDASLKYARTEGVLW
jgi:hypothetical protein